MRKAKENVCTFKKNRLFFATRGAIALVLSSAALCAHAEDWQSTTQELRKEIEELKATLKTYEQKQEKQDAAAQAQAAAPADKKPDATAPATPVDKPSLAEFAEKLKKGQLQIGHTNLSFDGWLAYTASWRAHNELAGPSQSGLPPFPVQAQYHSNEFRDGAPQTRFGFNTVSDTGTGYTLKSKLQFDTLSSSNAAGTANSGNWTPRVRMAWLEADGASNGWHFVAGQAYSLVVPFGNLSGGDSTPAANRAWMLLPGLEATTQPDDGFTSGLPGNKNSQVRIVRELSSNAAFALSFENNAVSWGGSHGTSLASSGAATSGSSLPTPVTSNSAFSSSTVFNSLGTIPDVVAKVGYDPTHAYHLEAWGALRQYKDAPGLTNLADTGSVYTGGGGLASYIKVVPGTFDIQSGVSYGSIGSMVGNIPDVTYNSNGKPVPIMDRAAYMMAIGHVNSNLDVILQGGIERGSKAGVSGDSTATAYGYGNPWGSGSGTGNAACMTLGALSGTGTCTQDNHTIRSISANAVWKVYNGAAGMVVFMPTLLYVDRTLFGDQNGYAPKAHNVSIDLALRYYPF